MALQDRYNISGIELADDTYTVIQGVFRNKYKAVDAAGQTVLRGKQELFKLKEMFPFVDGDGTTVFTVTASSVIDIAGDYVLSDAATDEPVVDTRTADGAAATLLGCQWMMAVTPPCLCKTTSFRYWNRKFPAGTAGE